MNEHLEQVVRDWDAFVLSKLRASVPNIDEIPKILVNRAGNSGQISPLEFSKANASGAVVAVVFKPTVRSSQKLREQAFAAFPEHFRSVPRRNSVAIVPANSVWDLLPSVRLKAGKEVPESMNPHGVRRELMSQDYLELEKFYVSP